VSSEQERKQGRGPMRTDSGTMTKWGPGNSLSYLRGKRGKRVKRGKRGKRGAPTVVR
jgi:hypothetical protein